MATEGQSRSFILQSLCWPTRVSISSYNIAGLISEDSEEVATQIAKNCRPTTPLSFDAAAKRNPREYPHKPYISRIIGLHFVAGCMGLSLFTFVQWALKEASFLQKRTFLPFKVIQGRPRSMILVPIESAHTTSY